MSRPPRLSSITYREPAAYFLTTCVHERRPEFTSADVVGMTLGFFEREAASNGVAIDAYCFMPDHVHLLVECSEAGDLRAFMTRAKQFSGYYFSQAHGRRLWQKGYFDRALRKEADRLVIIAYMVANPIRAGLCASSDAYPFWGAATHSREDILEAIRMGGGT